MLFPVKLSGLKKYFQFNLIRCLEVLILKKNKKSFLKPSNQITALPNAISGKIKWAQKILPVKFFPCSKNIFGDMH